jgi:predicted ATP-dependent endonuclease of OLD family
MPELLKSLSIENYRGFASKQTLSFAIPNGKPGSGLTMILGQNNSGKSTVLEVLRRFTPGAEFERADRYPGKDIRFELTNTSGETKALFTQGSAQSQIDRPDIHPSEKKLYFVISRRQWRARFAKSISTKGDYRNHEQNRSKIDPDNDFGRKLKEIESEKEKKVRFNKLMKRVFPDFSDWHVELDRGENFINYTTRGGVQHDADLFGDGVSSLLKMCALLLEGEQGDIIVIDEPELSLHPQAQKSLCELISEYSSNLQIIVISHSPYFIHWPDVRNGARIVRLAKKGDKECIVHGLSEQADYFGKLFTFAESWQQPQLLDTVAKEVFFSVKCLFVEGQEDVGLLKKAARDLNIRLDFDLFGYGVGGAGNISHLCMMARDLGIQTAAVYDGDKNADAVKAQTELGKDVFVETLPTDDIRDKHKKDPADCSKDLKAVDKEGLFDKSGNLKMQHEPFLKDLFTRLNTYFAG